MTTYRDAGVDRVAADVLVTGLSDIVRRTWSNEVIASFGASAAGVRLPEGYRHPILMLTTDGVGTKLDLACRARRLEGVGFDLVAMCVDDLATVGATPLGLCDYLAVGRIDPVRDARIVGSIATACRQAGCSLLGGETAEHPGLLGPDQFDLAGAALGITEENAQITGSSIEPGDAILGLASPNLRANGFSLVRKLVQDLDLSRPLPGTDVPADRLLLEPSLIYAPSILRAIAAAKIHGLVHVTGGGLRGKLLRSLPPGRRAEISWGSWAVPDVFRAIQTLGDVSDAEMLNTFNMGIGFLIICAPTALEDAISSVRPHDAIQIGEVKAGVAGVDFR